MNAFARAVPRLLQALLRRYAQMEAAAVLPFLTGRRLLDLGAGEGYVAAALRRQTGAWSGAVDVALSARASGAYVAYDGIHLPSSRPIIAQIPIRCWTRPCG